MEDNLKPSVDDTLVNTPEVGDIIRVERDALNLDLDEKEFIETLHDYFDEFDKFIDKYNVRARQEKNKQYLFGKQLEGKKFKDYEEEQQFLDNIIYEAESYIVPMAVSRLPDIVVSPGNDQEQSKQVAKDLSKIVSDDIKSRERKRVLKLGFKQHPVYFFSVIKAFWNPTKGRDGDYDFKNVHPDLCKFDTTAFSNNSSDMDWFAENIEYTVKDWVNRYPEAEQKIYKELRKMGRWNDTINEKTTKGMNSKVKGWEVWFTWTSKGENGKYERTEAVAWVLNEAVLKKMKSPNWDWEGEEAMFTYDDEKPADLETLVGVMSSAANGQPDILNQQLQEKKIFHNHLTYPDKPYYVMGYDQWGEYPIDATSRIEQVIQLQKNYDKRGTQITAMFDRARGKHVFSADQGLKKEELEELDISDPNTDLFVKGKVNEVHAFIQPELPSQAQIDDKDRNRERIFDKMGVHGPARGEVDMGAPATSNQLSREGDFTRSDDVTDDTINSCAEWMANWSLQFIKLRYTQDHFKKQLGQDGTITFQAVNRDMVEDGMVATVGASGTDKLKAEQSAVDSAGLNMIDPISYYTDKQMTDPKGRAEKLYLWQRNPDLYAQKFIYEGNPQGMLGAGIGANAQQAMSDIMQIQSGQVPQPPQQIDPTYLHTFMQFMQDPQGADLVLQQHPEIKQQLLAFAQAISELGKQMLQSGGQAPAGATPPGGAGPAQQPPQQNQPPQNAGPIGSQPSPTNTAKVPTMAPGRA